MFNFVPILYAALGNLDLNTLEKVSHFDPDTAPPHRAQPKYGTRFIPFSPTILWAFVALQISAVDPDPKGSDSFCRFRTRIISSDPEPKGSEYKLY